MNRKALVSTSFQLPSNLHGCGKADYIHRLVGYVRAAQFSQQLMQVFCPAATPIVAQ
jgi:hypothetical protein